jgi:hypothetical protein
MVSLKDSLELERQQAEKLKEIQLKHAMERLGAVAGNFKMQEVNLGVVERMAYRDRAQDRDGSEFEVDNEERDDEEGVDGIAVRFSGTEMDERGEDYS